MTKDDEFLARLLATFRVEAQEHLATMSAELVALERPAPAAEVPARVETLFREAHSLKGAARSVNLADVERLCQALERVLSAVKRNQLGLTLALYDTLYATLDLLGQLLARDVDGKPLRGAAPLAAQVDALDALLQPQAEQPRAPYTPARPEARAATREASAVPAGDTVRIATAKLELLLSQAEERHAHKFASGQLAVELQELSRGLHEWRRQWDKRARAARATRRSLARPGADVAASSRQVMQWLESVDSDELFATTLADRLAQIERDAAQQQRVLTARVGKLMDGVKQALMLPFGTLFEPLPKLVRDLARDSGKDVELVTRGAAIEVDRRILEQMKVPLTHLMRNAIDHGIEAPDARRSLGKPARGTITIELAAREGSKVQVQLSDDGAGISAEEVKAAARKSGLRAPQLLDAMDDAQALALVFESGLSTSPILTSLSGHGLGLAIVREKVERLGGKITLASTPGQGTRFSMLLPNTLATFRGLLVSIGERQFVLPSGSVERVGRVRREQIRVADGREAIELDQQALPLARLAEVLALRAADAADARTAATQHVAVLASGGQRMAFAVDEVIGDQEVLVKPLGPPLKRVRHIAAATVLGAGHLVPLLSVEDLMSTALRSAPAPLRRSVQVSAGRRSLLVAEDSVTTRALLKEILESAGYRVTTAADGIEALTALHAGDFDLLVSDVEMPRMDGFDLTARVRADRRLAELPVVLVTALESREDKERGVDVGANAYVVKSGFDKSRLLDIIRTLI